MGDISPDLFMDAVLAYQQTAAIKAARRFVASAYFAIILRSLAISKSTLTSISSPNLRRHSWTGAPLRGWAASSSIWPRPR
jgi:hypothetical protein